MAPSAPTTAPAGRSWRLREYDAAAAAGLSAELGLLPATARVLCGRGIRTVEAANAFLEPTLDALHSPFAFVQMEAAVDRLLTALRTGERIVVHGDYDVDGITGTVVLLVALRAVGADVHYLVPHRIENGYGLKPEGIERAQQMGARVVVAVDCGINAHDAADRARQLDVDLIVADHHQPGPELPPARAILNPRLPDSGYPEDDLAAVGVAFKLARGVLERHPKGMLGTALLKLVALGTVADLVPLTGENRVITYHGLATLGDAVNPGLRALMNVAGVRPPVTATDVGFRLAPRINAVGRLDHPKHAVEMFLTTDASEARRLARHLHETNARRQQIELDVVESALDQRPPAGSSVVVVAGEGWHRGVIGIVASRLVEAWGRPAVVLSIEEDEAFGSARSIPGFDIVGALGSVSGLVADYGGHPQAAGLRLPVLNVEPLREALGGTGGEELQRAVDRSAEIACDTELSLDDPMVDLALEIERLAPFGVGNPGPRFLCRDMKVISEPRVLKERHLKLRVAHADGGLDVLFWRRADIAGMVEPGDRIDAVGRLKLSRWRGKIEPQLELVDLDTDGSVAIA